MIHSIATWRSLRLALLISLLAAVSCKDDDEIVVPSITLEYPALYISAPSVTETVHFTTERAESMAVNLVPKGWTVNADLYSGILTVTSPDDKEGTETETSGTVSIAVYSSTGHAAYATLYVTREVPVQLDSQRSNCYVVTQAGKSYSIPIDRKGESDDRIAPESVGIVWQSPDKVVLYPRMEGADRMSFHIPTNEDGGITPGNALLAAYDSEGEVLWTWHLWITATQPQSAGGWMDRNLGAACASGETTDDVLNSYGTYYQWGRMTPFVGPYSYNCSASADAYMYGENSLSRRHITYEATSADTGTAEYAVSHPLVYLLGDEASGYDWNISHDNTLWSTAKKSIYDPCPRGWRVAKSFDGWAIEDDLAAGAAAYERRFGWNLGNGTETLFFLGGGRRSWFNGLITNVNSNETPKPWIGWYWTAEPKDDALSMAMYFSLDTDDAAQSAFVTAQKARRADGMQIRCIREE